MADNLVERVARLEEGEGMSMASAGQVLRELIALGRSGQENVPPSLADEAVARERLLPRGVSWVEVADALGPEDVENLIRGLVLYCRASGRDLGGSRSPVIWLYLVFTKRFPALEPRVTQWVVENRVNPYEPFGTLSDEGTTTLAEHRVRRLSAIRALTNEAG